MLEVAWNAEESVTRVVEAVLSTADALRLDYGVVASPFRDGDFNTDRVLRRMYLRDRCRYKQGVEIRRMIQKVARTGSERRGVPFFDSQNVIHEPQYFYDSVHLNSRGQDVYAEALGTWIRNEFLGPLGKAKS